MSDESKKGAAGEPEAQAAPVMKARVQKRAQRKLPLVKSELTDDAAAKAKAAAPGGVAFPAPAAPIETVDNKKLSRRNALRQMVGLSVGTSLAVIGGPGCEASYTNDYTNSYGGGDSYNDNYTNSGSYNDNYTNSGAYNDNYTNSGGYTNSAYTNYYVTYTNTAYTNYYVTYTNYYVTYTNTYTNYYVTYTNYYY